MKHLTLLFATLIAVTTTTVQASELIIPNSFTAGSRAVAAEANANFTAVAMAVNDNDGRIAALETLVADLQNRLDALETANVQALNDHVQVTTDPLGQPLVQFFGANVGIVNGVDQFTPNGLGNLFVGYNLETDAATNNRAPVFFCSDGAHGREMDCLSGGGIWSQDQRSGSHNLIVGPFHGYSSTGGVVFGNRNAINRQQAVVTGERHNLARGGDAVVSGGRSNRASGLYSSVSGGRGNRASGESSSVSGGLLGTASGEYDWVAGELFEDQ